MRFWILALLAVVGTKQACAASSYVWELPEWVPKPFVPQDNPMTNEKVILGRHLFYDKRLSKDQTISCSSCHTQAKAFTDGRRFSKGIDGSVGVRNAMSLTNVAYLTTLTWSNPQITSLEIQSLIPLFGESPVEMGMAGKEELLFLRLKKDQKYNKLFEAAYPKEAKEGDASLYSISTITKALASFQRTLTSFNSPYDQYKYGGNNNAISEAAKKGEKLFFGERMECYHCHGGFNFTNTTRHSKQSIPEKSFHNTGLYNTDGAGAYPKNNQGLIEFSGEAGDMGKFRTPTLRNISMTAPYMHDGGIQSLRDVLKNHYSKGGMAYLSKNGISPIRDELITGFHLEEEDIKNINAFLNSLTDESFINNPNLGDPWKKNRINKK